jgi:hypothetical protein
MNRGAYPDLLQYMAEVTNLEPTAALVMIWARDLYRTGSAADFYSLLDLSAGRRMKQECDTACPWYGQVVLNRKWFIRHLAEMFIAGAGAPCQVILPAAGKSPLALELLDACNEKIASVIETDIIGIEEKQRLYEQTAPAPAKKIRCVPVDLYDLQGTAGPIRDTGRYDPGLPTLVITEGISYYIPPADLSGIISLFASEGKKNRVVLDYMLPCRLVSDGRRRFPRGVWRVINRDCNPGNTVTYSPDEMEQALSCAGCDRVMQHPMHDIELFRTGTNRYFPAIPDGWIQVAEGRL